MIKIINISIFERPYKLYKLAIIIKLKNRKLIHFLNRSAGFYLRFPFAIFWILFFSMPVGVKAQEEPFNIHNLNSLIKHTDSILGADDELVNGKIYVQENLLADGYPFFLTQDWLEGNVVVNGKKHTGLFLKYNLYTDELVMKAERKRGEGASVISLNNEFVESFNLENRHFVNSINFKVKGIQTDFVELLYEGRFVFFVSYSKSFNNDYNTKTPFGNYGKTSTSYFMLREETLNYISSKNALYKHFEPVKKKIKKFMKKNKIKYAKATYEQLHSLMQYCDELSQ